MAYHVCDKRLTGFDRKKQCVCRTVLIFNVLQCQDFAIISGTPRA
jgi:hypothetical protein